MEKKSKIIMMMVGLLIALFGVQSYGGEEAIKIGWAEIDITPTESLLPVDLRGQMYARVTSTINDPLTATALAIESDAGEQWILVSIDTIDLGPGGAREWWPMDHEGMLVPLRNSLQGTLSGFDLNKLTLVATHTHTAPYLNETIRHYHPTHEPVKNNPYYDFAKWKLELVIQQAWNNRTYGGLSFEKGEAAVGFCRIVKYTDGHHEMYGDTSRPDFAGMLTPFDHTLELMYTFNPSGGLTGIMINIVSPSQRVGGAEYLSADFWYDVKQKLRQTYGNDIYILPYGGAAGEMSPWNLEGTRATRNEIGEMIADSVRKRYPSAMNTIKYQVEMKHTARDVNLTTKSYYHTNHPVYNEPRPTYLVEIHAVRLDNTAWVNNPFELFNAWGKAIQNGSVPTQTIIAQMSGLNRGGYLPTQEAVSGGAYSSLIQDGWCDHIGGQQLVDNSVDMINGLFEDDTAPIARNDSANTDEDVELTIDVLSNDTDPNGDTLYIMSITQPFNGFSAIDAVNGNDAVIYIPGTGFSGSDLFTYTISDSSETDTASVTVYVGSINYEAEDAEMSPAFAISSAHSGYTGTGYVDYAGEGYVKWTVELATEGNYDLVFRYALGSGNRPLHISVDSTSGGSTIDFPATGGWSTWGETRTTVSLTAGTHTIYASTTGLSGANVDHLSIEDATGTPPPNTPPTANAGADKAVQVNNTITITGSGTDPDGTIVSYEWKKGTTVLATTASFDYTPTVVGTDTLTLTVTDDDGEPGTDSMDVIVTEDPPPPPSTLYEAEDAEMSPAFAISSAHSGYTGTGYVDYTGEGYVKWTVELAAEGNYDLVFRYALGSGNRPLHISVDSTSGGSTIDFPATGGWSTWGETRTTVSLTAGTHTIYASTTGLSGANVDHLSIEDATGTPPPNTPPTADAGADKAVQVNNTITITGSGTDPDGTIVSYEWKKGTTVLATTASFDYTPTVVGTDTLTLTVTDDDGEPGTDSMDVIVTEDPPPNIPPTANAGPDKSVQVNQSVTITGSGTDPDGTIASYEWSKDGTVLATTASFDYTPTVVGTDTLTLTVTDDDGEPGTDSMDVIVTEDPPPPPNVLYEAEDAEMSSAFAISSAHSGYTGTGYVDYAGEGYVKWTVELATEGNYDLVFRYALGSGNRPLHISVDSTSGGSTIDFPATGGWSTWGETRTTVSLTAGTHTIYASTTGLSGANVDHLSIEDATGTPPPNTPPTADAGADKAVQVNNTITITGSGTDPDGTIASYEWSKDGTVLATTASFDYTPTVVGTDTLTLTVTDDDGAPGTDSMDVIVTEDTPPPPNVLYEAEDAEMSPAFAISSTHSGYTGTGYVDYAGEGYVKWTVELAAEGNYDLVFRYALGSGNRPLHISVDSTSGGSTIDFPATGGWSTWGETRTTVSLTAGTHTIYASTTGLSGANVDHLSIEDATGTPPPNTPPTADAGADKAVQVNNTITITGSGTDPDGTIASYEWSKDGTVLATTASFDYTPTVVGTDTLTLTVTDDDGAPGTDSMDVIVTATPSSAVQKGPYLIYDGANTEMRVLWQLDSSRSCTIDWGEDASYAKGTAGTSENGDGTYDHRHIYTITGLTPGIHYFYKVTCDSNYIGRGSFHSAPSDDADNVKFMVYGDTRSYPADHNSVNYQMINTYTTNPEYQTITLHVGDWVNNGDLEADWANQFFDSYYTNTNEFQANMPINGARGNHEGSGDLFYKYFPYLYEPGGFYWSFDYGPVHVTVIDQYVDYSPGSTQYIWLENDLSSSTKKWKFLVFHEPGWSADGPHSNNVDVQNYIQPLAVEKGVDIIFAGHNHYYARATVDSIQHITTGGGGAPLYSPDPNYENVVATAQSHHFCEVEIQGDDLYFTARDASGLELDSFHMD
ncbi:PKD domain-containing protein [Sulfurovum sp. CS9]|uniref:PKD domain-containing protein n=1 Tax=Sulfurovum sp. CS9 TaxID=3391146 RepID=UPI0039EAE1E4